MWLREKEKKKSRKLPGLIIYSSNNLKGTECIYLQQLKGTKRSKLGM